MQPIPDKVLNIQLGYNPVSTKPAHLDTKKKGILQENK
jgi:hypothetical protein